MGLKFVSSSLSSMNSFVKSHRVKRVRLIIAFPTVVLFGWLLYWIIPRGTRPIQGIPEERSRKSIEDRTFLNHFSKFLNDMWMCNPSYSIAVGGLSHGQAASILLSNCPDIRLHGFEISSTELAAARENLAQYPNVIYNHMGMGDVNEVVHFTDNGEIGGIYGASDTKPTVRVIPLAEYFARASESLTYVLIDVLGYEPLVISGMGLQHERNRRRFPIFQYRLGGAWAKRDTRHPKGSMNQMEIAAFLINRGYELFMVGETGLYPVSSAEYFKNGDREEGRGSFVEGNVLAVHPDFTYWRIVRWIRSKT